MGKIMKKLPYNATDIQDSNSIPDYKRIYTDILELKFPDKTEQCRPILNKAVLTELDILALNEKIFGKKTIRGDYKEYHRAYSETGIRQILNYQKKHLLTNLQLADKFGMSRNTITRWKKIFKV